MATIIDHETEGRYVPIREAAMITSIQPQVLRKYADEGTIKSYKTPSGHRRFSYDDLQKIQRTEESRNDQRGQVNNQHGPINDLRGVIRRRKLRNRPVPVRIHYIYVRAATVEAAQEQSRFILADATDRAHHVIVSDIGISGGGFTKRAKGIATLMDACLRGVVGEVVVAHRDRLDQVLYSMLHFMIHKAGGKLVSLNADAYRATEGELAEEVLSIVSQYSNRSKKNTVIPSPAVTDEVAIESSGEAVAPLKKRRGRPPRATVATDNV